MPVERIWKMILLKMSQVYLDIIFSVIFLLLSYFFSVLGIIHGYIPGGIKKIMGKKGKIKEEINISKVFGLSFIIASLLTGFMFFNFILPTYQ
ncbi:hypothetical protein [Cecembia sp.]|uniref:hypothetical protein n=1 Tax=Cecembia sp. TaxID=1898110 RepID=UPI0025C4EE32|nr:hypothetical protein [Cecembia sp.]